MQIGILGYPDAALTEAQITRCLEAYLLWLFGKVMFIDSHVDTISARFINMAREIAEAHHVEDIVPRSFGVYSDTYLHKVVSVKLDVFSPFAFTLQERRAVSMAVCYAVGFLSRPSA